MQLVLDSTVVSQLCVPRRNPELAQWFTSVLRNHAASVTVVLPEVVDYEVRRGLLYLALKAGQTTTKAIGRLDAIGENCVYAPIVTEQMCQAALFWAEARVRGTPTAPPDRLDADAILAAQAIAVGGIVITDNVRHLEQFVAAKRWQDIAPDELG